MTKKITQWKTTIKIEIGTTENGGLYCFLPGHKVFCGDYARFWEHLIWVIKYHVRSQVISSDVHNEMLESIDSGFARLPEKYQAK